MTAPRVSILLPVHNAATTIDRAIQSIRAQTFPDWELLAIDDHCGDATPSLLARHAAEDARIRLLQSPARGIVAALQVAAVEARAPLLARMDADDIAAPERLAKQVLLLDKQPDVEVCSCHVTTDTRDNQGFREYVAWLNALQTPDQHTIARFLESPVAHPTVMMRRETYDAAGGYRDCAWAEDYDLWLRMMERGARFAKVPQTLLHWSEGEQRLTRTDTRYSSENFRRCRAHYLARMGTIRERGVLVSAPGKIGKKVTRSLLDEGVRVHGFIDVHPRRVGREVMGLRISGTEEMQPPATTGPVHIVALGFGDMQRRARTWFLEQGYEEGRDFWCVG